LVPRLADHLMGKRKPVSILKRSAPTTGKLVNNRDSNQPSKRQKTSVEEAKVKASQHKAWIAVSIVDRQAAYAVAKLLRADATGSGGASIKSLTLGPAVKAKKATYAVTCETLRMLSVIQEVLGATDMLAKNASLTPETAYVLCYELLFGEGFSSIGPAEKAVIARQSVMEAKLADMVSKAGVTNARDLAAPSPDATAGEHRPRTARVNTLKMTVNEALKWLRSPPHNEKWAHRVICYPFWHICNVKAQPFCVCSAFFRRGPLFASCLCLYRSAM
jgi:putative methyltransferase